MNRQHPLMIRPGWMANAADCRPPLRSGFRQKAAIFPVQETSSAPVLTVNKPAASFSNPGVTRSRRKVLIEARMPAETTSTGLRTGRCQRHALRSGGNAIRQVNVPPPFVVIYFQHNAGIAGKMVAGRIHDNVIRPHLRNRDGTPFAEQLHFYVGGMAAAAGF